MKILFRSVRRRAATCHSGGSKVPTGPGSQQGGFRAKLSWWDCRRGFLEHAELSFDQSQELARELFDQHPLRILHLRGVRGYDWILNYPQLGRLSKLILGPISGRLTVKLARQLAPFLKDIGSLQIYTRGDGAPQRILKEALGDRLQLST
ncbi:MAG: hypothetical protein AB7K24_04910 [Gemmataceae bacterium]